MARRTASEPTQNQGPAAPSSIRGPPALKEYAWFGLAPVQPRVRGIQPEVEAREGGQDDGGDGTDTRSAKPDETAHG